MRFLKENESLVKEALRGKEEIDDYMKTAKDIGIKTLGDLRKFKDEEGSAELKDLKAYRKTLPKDFKPVEESFEDEHLGGEAADDISTAKDDIKSILDRMLNDLINYVKNSGKPVEDILGELRANLSIPTADSSLEKDSDLDDDIIPVEDVDMEVDDFNIEPIDFDSIEVDDDLDFDIALDTPNFSVNVEDEKEVTPVVAVEVDDTEDKTEEEEEPIVDYVNENVTATPSTDKPVNLEEIK